MQNFNSYSQLLVQLDDGIATVSLNRPEVLNAINERMHEELATVFSDLGSNPEVKCIVLTGAGSAFSSGGDIDWMQEMIDVPEKFYKTAREGKKIIFSLLDCEKPIIAKVNGVATGLAATVALFCDIIYAAETAKIGDPHVSVGFVAGDGGAVIWPMLVGFARAKEYLMTGGLLSAAEAERIGLINKVYPVADLDGKVSLLARSLAGGPCRAINWTKMSVNILLRQAASAVLDASLAYEACSNVTRDHQEAVTAFKEKRRPVFVGA